ncbi:sensor histidine kinase [Actinomadura kijaniata]|uniref:sensor histidine kinase n=1 Tax=Actinomadura kijaniata TaxID=46161 RepID=UPI0008324C4F|nr:sensor histidine kinase [Actinomadura kijaniata]
MTVPTSHASRPADPFWHPALFYRGLEQYLAGTVPFVVDGVRAGEPVAVAVPTWRLEPLSQALREELGATADAVTLLDMTRAGRNPGRIIPGVLRAFADRHPQARVRIIGEPIWPGRSASEYPACAQHEALINHAFTGRDVAILCPYDLDGLDERVVADAAATHPVLIDADGEAPSDRYAPDAIVAAYNQPLPDPAPGQATTLPFDRDALERTRALAIEHAVTAGLDPERVLDVELAISELISNSVIHGGGTGTLRMWIEPTHLVLDVSDQGHLTDPLVGRRPVPPDTPGGRGVLLVNQLADLVRIHTIPQATTVRVYFTR